MGHITDLGYLGVNMFFVISGFIITMLLLREFQRTQTVSLKHFYLRRGLRILPAYVFFLLGIGLFTWMGSVALRTQDWLAAMTYTVSFQEKPAWDIGHIWSLSVEEHFYCVWPLVVWAWPRRCWVAAVAAIVATPALRYGLEACFPTHNCDHCTLTRMDTIAVGCCLAYLAQGGGFRRMANVASGSAYLVTACMVLLVGGSHLLAQRLHVHAMILHPFAVAGCFAATIWIWVNHPTTWIGLPELPADRVDWAPVLQPLSLAAAVPQGRFAVVAHANAVQRRDAHHAGSVVLSPG